MCRTAFLITPIATTLLFCGVRADTKDSPLQFTQRYRIALANNNYEIRTKDVSWQPSQTAIIVCDMWDAHHCLNAVRRVEELVPVMNRVLEKVRKQGVLIVHAPSGCMEAYKEHAARKRAQNAPRAPNLPKDIGSWCSKIPAEEKGTYPIDQSDGGEDDDPLEHEAWIAKLKAKGLNPRAPWKSEHAGLKIYDEDAISDSGVEIWNLLAERGINNVILLGVHTNMCVLGRPFGLRQMIKNGKNAVLMRDMTDTMYNPQRTPFVSHFRGTELIIEHIEKFISPTITSDQIVGGRPFRFKGDTAEVKTLTPEEALKRVNEKVTVEMLVKTAKNRLEKRGEIYLDSEEDFRDEKNLGIIITKRGAAKFKEAGVEDPAEHFKEKTIRVTGILIVKDDRPRIEVNGPGQIRIMNPRGKD